VPTETVYGLAALPPAEAALREAKGRDADKPFTWAVASIAAAERSVDLSRLGPAKLARRFWPGPLTLLLAATRGRRDARRARAGPRIALALLKELDAPLLLTSANRSGEGDALTAQEALAALDGPHRARARRRAGAARRAEHRGLVRGAARARPSRRDDRSRHGAADGRARRAVRLLGQHVPQPDGARAAREMWADQLAVKPQQLLEHGGMVLSAGRTRRRLAREPRGGRPPRRARHRPGAAPRAAADDRARADRPTTSSR
jgi:hypothetical protein